MKIIIIIIIAAIISGCNKPESTYQGYVEGRFVYLVSPYSGILQTACVKRGEHVTKGDALFSLDPKPQEFNIAAYEASGIGAQERLLDMVKPLRTEELAALRARILQVQARVDLAEIRVKRFGTLYRQNAGNKDTYDAAVSNLDQLKGLLDENIANLSLGALGSRINQLNAQAAEVALETARLDNALWQLQQKALYAPSDGYIFDVYYSVGEFVPAERPIATMLPPENTFIEFFVPLAELKRLAVGSKITFVYQGQEQPETAYVSYIAPSAEFLPPLVYSRDNDHKIVFRVKADIPQHGARLFPGLPVSVSIYDE